MAGSRVFQALTVIYIIRAPTMILQTIVSLILIFVILFTKQLNPTLSKWMLWSVTIGFISYGVRFFFRLPILLYRYEGVIDLIMLFGWLMIIDNLLRMEFAVEVGPD